MYDNNLVIIIIILINYWVKCLLFNYNLIYEFSVFNFQKIWKKKCSWKHTDADADSLVNWGTLYNLYYYYSDTPIMQRRILCFFPSEVGLYSR